MHAMVTDHRKLPRRRGDALNAAIYQATLDELAEVGYAGLTMEGVAERAKASKASLYRRWPTRIELVMERVTHQIVAFVMRCSRGKTLSTSPFDSLHLVHRRRIHDSIPTGESASP